MHQRKRYIPFLEVPVVEHCNLNCELCNSHANYIDSSTYDFEQFKTDLGAYLCKKTRMKACQYCLMGKEESIKYVILAKNFGFMHPTILKLYYHHSSIYHTYKKIKKIIQVDEAIGSRKGSMVSKRHKVLKH